jgi:diguanylate cyclase (GGDEF)-like protein
MDIDDIFAREKKVVIDAENILASKTLSTTTDAEHYKQLLDEYKKLLRQMRSMIKISDITQQRLNSMSNDLEILSNHDELTQLYNRRFFNETYEKEWYNAMRSGSPLGILMIDVDNFKEYNDTYGHLQGDECLKEIAMAIKKSANRSGDLAARFGGDEFIVLLPNTNTEGCSFFAKKILANVSSLNLLDAYKDVTVSIGTGYIIPKDDMEMDILLNKADEALYQAKNEGRSCYR